MRLSEAIETLCTATWAEGNSPRTVEAYREKLGHLVDFLGDVDVGEVTTQDLRGYMAHQRDRGLSPFTIQGHVRHFKRLFNFLEDEEMVDGNPARRIKTPQPEREDPKGISWDDFNALLKATEGGSALDLRDHAIILFLADTGCRVGALCSLTAKDLDWEHRLARVTGKGKKRRAVFCQEATMQALAAWLEVRPEDKGPWVFVGLTPKSKQMNAFSVGKMLRRRGEQAGCTGPVNPHSFRHGFARAYLMAGGDLAILSKILGHTNVAVTVKYYAVFDVGELQQQHALYSPVARLESGTNGG